ncbi:hypothetical protein U9M48_030942 [Paspalum notatum var. saurae]|uniref:Uncharacterized protein n=1 Tax=Paspalum notatum var. saurae TaxID=547442 RepID=A0AAQ3U402_PASNO
MIENATKEVYTALLPKTMIIADLGCSAGPNTLMFISNVIRFIADQSKSSGDGPVEVQFFLNDLPGNDFNELFQLIQNFKRLGTTDEKAHVPPLYYISGLPDSYYNRLFPRESVHLFHSSFCLHWRSQGLVEKKKVESFNIPVYGPSVAEIKDVVMESDLFIMDHIKLIETTWDPFDDSEGDEVEDIARSSTNITKCIRSLLKSLVVCHFGETILEPLFKEFTYLVAKHLEKEKTKAAIIAMTLKKE